MKLYDYAGAPNPRRVKIFAAEKGIDLELVHCDITKREHKVSGFLKKNPSGKIPTMVLEDGTALFDSRVICAYLDSIHDGKKLTPRSGAKRFEVMTLEALGDGIMDAAVNNRYETAMRPAEFQWIPWSEGQMGKVNASLDQLEASWLKSLGRVPNMGSISVAAALGYLEFRYPDLKWRKNRKGLARWFKRFSERPSFIVSKPD